MKKFQIWSPRAVLLGLLMKKYADHEKGYVGRELCSRERENDPE